MTAGAVVGGVVAATAPDIAVFAIAAAVVLVGAVGVVIARNPVHAALLLVMTLFGVAVLFVAQEAHFLAAIQVIVYAGAIVVLFLFVIMFLGVDRREDVRAEPLPGQRPAAVVIGLVALAELIALGQVSRWATGRPALSRPEGPNVNQLAERIFTRYLYAFEVTSVLLVIAVAAAVVLVRRAQRSSEALPDVEEVAP